MKWIELLSSQRFGDKKGITNNDTRSRFDQDFDRLIFSHPFRKLQDKTQVFPLPEDDFVHTRLTHSLEVSSVGRSLGKAVGEFLINKHEVLQSGGFTIHDFGSIVGAASLAHDLGNPPFGHSGESAISSFFIDNEEGEKFEERVTKEEWSDLINFEGNAQGFRILNDEENGGLKLTFATLGAFTKYPKSSFSPTKKERKSQKKYGVYRGNFHEFSEMAKNMGLRSLGEETWCRHPLAFLVEAADDICYNIIDLEDGCRLGLVDFETTRDLLVGIIRDNYNEEKLNKVEDQNNKLGMLRALAISQLIKECVQLFNEKEEEILQGKFDQALTDCIPSAEALAAITQLSIEKIYRSRQVLEREAGGFEVIGSLMKALTMSSYHKLFDKDHFTPKENAVFRLLPVSVQSRLNRKSDSIYEMLMIIMDFISSLTDSHAIKLYRIIYGYSLPV